MMQDFTKLGLHLDEHRAECPRNREDRLPTAFVWRNPADIAPRSWLYFAEFVS